MAGRERSGPVAAQADLFEARPWALCPWPEADPHRVAMVERLVRDCGADPLVIDAAAHDQAVALGQPPASDRGQCCGWAAARADEPLVLSLAGQGLRDTVRIAGSDPRLWTDIVTANAASLASPGATAGDGAGRRSPTPWRRWGRQIGEGPNEVEMSIKRLNDFSMKGRQGYGCHPGQARRSCRRVHGRSGRHP